MPRDVIGEALKEANVDIEEALEKKPSDRNAEFARVTDIFDGVRNDFMKNTEMSVAEAIEKIQGDLTKLAPRKEAPRPTEGPPISPSVGLSSLGPMGA